MSEIAVTVAIDGRQETVLVTNVPEAEAAEDLMALVQGPTVREAIERAAASTPPSPAR